MTQRKTIALVAALLAASFGLGYFASSPQAAEKKDAKVFELRIYTCHEGRLPALHKRFRDHTNALFVKHGMELIGYWTPTEGDEAENTLVYIIAHKSRSARDASFKAFSADPVWQKAYKESKEDGPIVKKVENQFLKATDYSKIK